MEAACIWEPQSSRMHAVFVLPMPGSWNTLKKRTGNEQFMNSQKIDTELLLSLELTEAEREKSLDLSVGYDAVFEEWEVIVKYSGDLTPVEQELSVRITPLLNEYAILRIREDQLERLAEYPQIEYIEKPKALILEEMEGIRASCINPVRLPPYSLTGAGVVIAIIDSGACVSKMQNRTETKRGRQGNDRKRLVDRR